MPMTAAELKTALKQFSGTEQWFRHSLFRAHRYTDGVRF